MIQMTPEELKQGIADFKDNFEKIHLKNDKLDCEAHFYIFYKFMKVLLDIVCALALNKS